MVLFCGSFVFFVSCVSHAFASVHCCLVVASWERTDLLSLVGNVYCNFVTFPCGILGHVWYLIVSFSDLCLPQLLSIYEEGWSCAGGLGALSPQGSRIGLFRVVKMQLEKLYSFSLYYHIIIYFICPNLSIFIIFCTHSLYCT